MMNAYLVILSADGRIKIMNSSNYFLNFSDFIGKINAIETTNDDLIVVSFRNEILIFDSKNHLLLNLTLKGPGGLFFCLLKYTEYHLKIRVKKNSLIGRF